MNANNNPRRGHPTEIDCIVDSDLHFSSSLPYPGKATACTVMTAEQKEGSTVRLRRTRLGCRPYMWS